MRPWVVRFLFALSLVFSVAVARANEVDDARAATVRLEGELGRLEADRAALARAYAERAQRVAALKAQPASWARDRKLQALLAEAKDMATALDGKESLLSRQRDLLAERRQALVAAIDRELASETPRREALAKERVEVLARLGAARRLRIPDESIAPDDDAEDLSYKAGALAHAEAELRAEEQRLARRAVGYRRQARLVKSRARAEEQDVFYDAEPRRTATANREDVSDYPTGPPTVPPTGPPNATDTTPAPGDLVFVLAEAVDAGTLDELRQAERAGDPESRAKAAERAARSLAARAEKLRQRREEMERRARELRGESP